MALAWDEFDGAIEMLRIMFDVPEAWSSTFESRFKQALAPRVRLALPGVAQRTRWTGGDATAATIGCIDWGWR